MSENHNSTALKMDSVSKSFGGFQALRSVSFCCQEAEVHGLVGENGAGKTTLVKILAGEYQPDKGDVFLRGEKLNFKNPRQAKEKGISLIHQESTLIPYLNAAENLFLGKEPRSRLGFIDSTTLYQRAKEVLDQLNIALELEAVVARLTVAQRQLLEIAKSLQENPQILIMDEPTAALQRNEIDTLFSLIKRIKRQGKRVIFISHRLEEVFEIADRITVLRNGEAVLTVSSEQITKDRLIEAIIGRRLEKFFPPKAKKKGKELIRIEDLTRSQNIRNVNLVLREGEMLGIAGLEGQGQHSLLRTLFGADLSAERKGEVKVKGRSINLAHPKYTVRVGFGFVSDDRHTEGLVLNLSVEDNISLPGLYKRARLGFIKSRIEKETVEKGIKALSIKAPSRNSPVKYLSGGNQQKVVLAKWLAADTDVFIFDEPTRGVDIGTRAEIYRIMRDLANEGKAIIISSRDLDEVIGMSDRIAVIHKGKIIKEFESGELSQEETLDLITRVPREEKEKQLKKSTGR
ncbi:sugar ABC transporter ATP-binding protein [Candidatus Aerophobetes bacterium]|uniref:Sugar ABC transporter ATP-binding protein n=1 Tax=Aerophobetes bacterium TaxID=2030807 RepID=A0A523QH02_UNCAE|nr:MAG: sugar ABC transporter ATP-binding protein [Candidatus Aerophobetes bacterium]